MSVFNVCVHDLYVCLWVCSASIVFTSQKQALITWFMIHCWSIWKSECQCLYFIYLLEQADFSWPNRMAATQSLGNLIIFGSILDLFNFWTLHFSFVKNAWIMSYLQNRLLWEINVKNDYEAFWEHEFDYFSNMFFDINLKRTISKFPIIGLFKEI